MNSEALGPPLGLTVVVPVYNGEATLRELVEELAPVLAGLGATSEVLLVDDGSADSSWETVAALAAERPWLRGLRLARNFGQHNALLCGVRAARGAVIVTLDDDLQHPAAEIPRLLERVAAGADVVYGTPREERRGLGRRLASRVVKWALRRAMGVAAAEQVSPFRAFRASLRDGFSEFSAPYVSLDVLLSWTARRFVAVEVEHRASAAPASRYSWLLLADHALNLLTGFSVTPLRLASAVGFLFTAFGVAVFAYVVGRFLLFGGSVPGFPFLASIIAVFSGAQLFALGIMGEYLARIFFRSLGRPAYVLAETTPPRRDP